MNASIFGGIFVATLFGLIFSSELPGTWWQWVLATVVALFAFALASGEEDR